MITPSLQAPLNTTGPRAPAVGTDTHPYTRDLHVYPHLASADDPKHNPGSATTHATNTATTPATSPVAADQPDWSAGAATAAADQPEWPVSPFPQVTAHEEEKSMKSSPRTPFAVTLGVCTLVSLAGNVGAATLLPQHLALPTPAVIAAASVAPLLLPAAVHLVPRAVGLPKGARGVVVFAVIVASFAAFALSFASLMAVAQASGHPGRLGALLPLAVDVLAGAAAYALVVMPAGASIAEQPVQPVHHPVHQADQSTAAATPTPVHQPTAPALEQLVHQVSVTAPKAVHQPGAPAVTSDDEVVHQPAAPVHQEPGTEPVHTTTGRPRLAAVHRTDAPEQDEAVQAPERVVHQRTEAAPVQSPVVQPVHREQAQSVVQAGGIELAVEKVAEIYARKDAGQSQNEIANAKVAAKRTVAKVLARRELATEPAEEPEPAERALA